MDHHTKESAALTRCKDIAGKARMDKQTRRACLFYNIWEEEGLPGVWPPAKEALFRHVGCPTGRRGEDFFPSKTSEAGGARGTRP